MSDSHDSPTIPDLIKKFHFVGGVLVIGTIITFVIDIMFALPPCLGGGDWLVNRVGQSQLRGGCFHALQVG